MYLIYSVITKIFKNKSHLIDIQSIVLEFLFYFKRLFI